MSGTEDLCFVQPRDATPHTAASRQAAGITHATARHMTLRGPGRAWPRRDELPALAHLRLDLEVDERGDASHACTTNTASRPNSRTRSSPTYWSARLRVSQHGAAAVLSSANIEARLAIELV